MQSCYNFIATFPCPKFMLDHVHLISDVTTFLLGWLHFPFRFVKTTFGSCFSFYTIFSSHTFHSHTFYSYTFDSYAFNSYTFHSYTIHSYTFHSYTFHLYAFHWYTFHSYTFHSYTFHSYTIHSYTFHVSMFNVIQIRGSCWIKEGLGL